jgi:hypothetical protein
MKSVKKEVRNNVWHKFLKQTPIQIPEPIEILIPEAIQIMWPIRFQILEDTK